MSDSFVHLHNHSSYSLLDGASKIETMAEIAARQGSPAIGVTDHGNCYALLDFYKACTKVGVKPILGTEAYIAAGSRFDKTSGKTKETVGDEFDANKKDKLYHHITLLCESNEGYQNLLKVSSDAYINGYYYKPRTDLEFLAEHSKGLIATTGCLGGLVLQPFLQGNYEKGKIVAAYMQDIFGKDNLFVELQDHGIPEQAQTNPMLMQLARELNAPLLATNDCHYPNHADHEFHDVMLCIGTRALVSDEKRFKFQSDQHYIKSPAEMRALFDSWAPQACDNTLLIAERCDVKIPLGEIHLPDFPLPDGYLHPIDYLRDLAYEGLLDRYDVPTPEMRDRMNFELGVIEQMGFPGYFLIIWDLVKHAKATGIRVGPGRGSAAGCLVSYCLGITELDPIKYGLMFERFLNPSRISMPDIDLDMSAVLRDKMIDYAKAKYGEDRVAQIITFNQIKSRSAVRDVARVMGYDWTFGDQLARTLPPLSMGRDVPLSECLDPESDGYDKAGEFREFYNSNPDVKRIVDTAVSLEGLHRSDGVHAAAVVIADQPIINLTPLQKKPKTATVTQYDMHGIEDLGLLKMDFLGLQTLDVIQNTLELLEESGITLDIESIPTNDFETLALLRTGQSLGVFQLESGGMQALLRRMLPTDFEDIAALVALYRPGPMAANMHNDYSDRKNGRQGVVAFHEDATEILSDTYGLMIYQESVMAVAQQFAGYTLAEADNLRKAMGKKIAAMMKAQRVEFIAGCVRKGYSERLATDLFDVIDHFSDYAFCKAHAYGYGWIAYQTAYLKAHHPLEYMAALCTNASPLSKVGLFCNEIQRLGYEVLPPSVNDSGANFTVERHGAVGAVRIGLGAIDGLGPAELTKILDEHSANGRFSGLSDLVRRTNIKAPTLEALANSGALDEFGETRLGVASCAKEITALLRKSNKGVIDGQLAMFDQEEGLDLQIPKTEYTKNELLNKEKSSTGVYLSGHPLEGFLVETTETVGDILMGEYRHIYEVSGVINNLNLKMTKDGRRMCTFLLSDHTDSVECVVFAKTFQIVQHHIHEGAGVQASIVIMADKSKDVNNYVVNAMFPLEKTEAEESTTESYKLYLPKGFSRSDAFVTKLKEILLTAKGTVPVTLHMSYSSAMKLPETFNIEPSDALTDQVRALFADFARR